MPNSSLPLSCQLSRRELLIAGGAAAASLLGSAVPLSAWAQKPPQEGTDYVSVTPPQTTEHPGKIEVTEFFGFWCPHCNDFDPILNAWIKKQQADVAMRYVPIAFFDQQVPLQRLFYTLEVLGQSEALRSKVFYAIHVAKTPLDTAEQQATWAAANGIDKKKYLDLYNSFSVQSSARRASNIATAYSISSVPSLAVNGKYVVLGSETALNTVDYLVAQERRSAK